VLIVAAAAGLPARAREVDGQAASSLNNEARAMSFAAANTSVLVVPCLSLDLIPPVERPRKLILHYLNGTSLAFDFRTVSSVSARAQAAAVAEITHGRIKLALRDFAAPYQRPASPVELEPLVRIRVLPHDFGTSFVPWSRRERALVNCQQLGRRLLKCAAEAAERVAVVKVVEVAFVFSRRARDVESRLLART
jgi:hypothetical protein